MIVMSSYYPCDQQYDAYDCQHQCPPKYISKPDVATCKFVKVDIINAPITSINEICVKTIAPITGKDKFCKLMKCCTKTSKCLKELDPYFEKKITCKGHVVYSGPVKAQQGVVDMNTCNIEFSGISINCHQKCDCS